MHVGDALKADLAALDPPPTALVANLAYNIAIPLIMTTIAELPAMRRWAVMVQRELAERLFAVPSTKAYAAVSVLVQLACRKLEARPVPRPASVRGRAWSRRSSRSHGATPRDAGGEAAALSGEYEAWTGSCGSRSGSGARCCQLAAGRGALRRRALPRRRAPRSRRAGAERGGAAGGALAAAVGGVRAVTGWLDADRGRRTTVPTRAGQTRRRHDGRNGSTAMMEVAAPAKLNLALLVGPMRHDGFHEIASLMVPVTLADRRRVRAHARRRPRGGVRRRSGRARTGRQAGART